MTDLRSNVEKAWDAKKPLFHRRESSLLCQDRAELIAVSEGTCWLVSFPYTAPRQAEGRSWYHFMLDSWVWGEVGMLGGWAVGQSFKNAPVYTSFEDIERVCQEIEAITQKNQG
jgi:kynureninase